MRVEDVEAAVDEFESSAKAQAILAVLLEDHLGGELSAMDVVRRIERLAVALDQNLQRRRDLKLDKEKAYEERCL